jgi:hypothetical protein
MAIDINHSEHADFVDSAERLHASRSIVPVARTYDPEAFGERTALPTSNFDLATVPPRRNEDDLDHDCNQHTEDLSQVFIPLHPPHLKSILSSLCSHDSSCASTLSQLLCTRALLANVHHGNPVTTSKLAKSGMAHVTFLNKTKSLRRWPSVTVFKVVVLQS